MKESAYAITARQVIERTLQQHGLLQRDSKKNEYVAFRSEAVVTKTGYSLLTGEA